MSQASTASPPPFALDRVRVIVAGMSALILTVGLARFAYTPMLPVMRAEAGLGALAGGWLATFNYMGYILGALIASMVPDLSSKYRLYRWGLLLALATTLGMGLTDNGVIWSLLRFLSGLASAAGMLLASGMVLNWLIRHGQAPELGIHFAGMGVGVALSGLAVEAMAGHLSWDGQWIALGGLSLLFLLPAWFWLPAPEATAKGAAKAEAVPLDRGWMGLFLVTYFCAGFGYVISATFIVAILGALPMLTGLGNWIWVAVGVTALPSTFLWDRIASRIGPIPALLFAYALQILSFLLSALFDGAVPNLLGAVLFGGTFVGIVSLTLALIGRKFPANPAKAMARLTVGYGVAQILAPALAGWIAEETGGYRGALSLAVGVMAVGMALLLAMGWRERRLNEGRG
jgi:MFS family permease